MKACNNLLSPHRGICRFIISLASPFLEWHKVLHLATSRRGLLTFQIKRQYFANDFTGKSILREKKKILTKFIIFRLRFAIIQTWKFRIILKWLRKIEILFWYCSSYIPFREWFFYMKNKVKILKNRWFSIILRIFSKRIAHSSCPIRKC